MNELPEQSSSQQAERMSARAKVLSRLARYRNLLGSKWWVLAVCIVLGLVIQAGVHFTEPPTYLSVGRMIVNIKLAIPEGSVYTEELSNFLGTQTALMQSGVVVNRAHARVTAKDPQAQTEPVLVKVSVLPKTTIFVLTASGKDPEYTRAYLEACMEEYILLKKEMRTQTSETTLAGLTEEILRLQKELRKADDDLASFQTSNSVVVLQEQGNSAGNYLVSLNQRLAMLKSEYELLRSLSVDQNLERQQDLVGKLPMSADLPAKNNQQQASDMDYLRAKQHILLLKAEQQELAEYLRPKHPKMIALTEELARRERLLEIYRQQGSEQIESRKQSLALQVANLEKDVLEWDAKALDVSRKTAEYQRLKANSTRIQQLYDRLLATMQTLDVNKEISPESVTIMEKASPPFLDRPTLSKKLLIGAVLGLAFGIGVLLIIDRLDDRIASFGELQEVFEEVVLAQVPREKSTGRDHAVALIHPHDERFGLVEAFRNLRSSLVYLDETNQPPRSLLITSSIPGEGKSFTASNIAIALANAGTRVLLVDADLRKGVLHQRFEAAPGPGLSEALARKVSWEEATLATSVPNLSLLQRGEFTSRTPELLLSNTLAVFIKDASSKYDCVILDTPPVMAADDVANIAPHVGGVLFVLRAEHTSARVARASLEGLYQRRANVLGLVFNAVRPSSGDYYYYKYKDYYQSFPAKQA